ncbi:MAG: gliding motility-associated C-terminal domain-containing protein, partial [Ferruginibacter sp.]
MNIQAQKETWHWYFANKAGIDFSSGFIVADTNGKMAAYEGHSSISDSAGNLLFYSNGLNIWTKNHQIMDNGSGLFGHNSSTQSSIVVKHPGNDSIYYIYTLDAVNSYNPPNHKGFRYNIVNINANNGLGKVIQKNILITDLTCEQFTAIKHCNGKDMWLIVAIRNSNAYHAYLLTSNGIITNPVISVSGIGSATDSWCAGYMKATPDGRKIAISHAGNLSYGVNVEIFDFDNATGILSNPMPISCCSITSNLFSYGVEFSPNQKYLFVSYFSTASNGPSFLYQYDISSTTPSSISQSAVMLYWNYDTATLSNTHNATALQMGCDNKIYCSFAGHNYLGVINYPDSAGLTCNLVKNGVDLNGRLCTMGLPTFFPGFFNKPPDYTYTHNCLTFNFAPVCDSASLDSIRWHFGDIASGINNTSALYAPQHKFSDTGNYTVKVYYHYKCRTDSVIKTINVQLPAYSFPQSYITDTITPLCKQLSFMPVCDSASLDSLHWNFGDPASGIANTANWYNPWHTFSDTGNYNVTLILYAFCLTDTVHKTVQVSLPVSNFTLGMDTTLCNQDSLQLQGSFQSVLPASYQWQNGDTTSAFWIKQAGEYWVKLNAGGCYFTDTVSINYQQTPTVQLPNDTIICEDSRVDISIPQGNYNILWNDGSLLSNRSFNMAATYTVSLSNFCGTATDNFILETKSCNCYLYIPNAFTPTGDGLNECFKAVYDCEFEHFQLYIYNRWGQLVYESQNPADCW